MEYVRKLNIRVGTFCKTQKYGKSLGINRGVLLLGTPLSFLLSSAMNYVRLINTTRSSQTIKTGTL